MTNKLSEVDGIGPATVKKLKKANIFTADELAGYNHEELSKIEGIGIKSAKKWISSAKQLIGGARGIPESPQIAGKDSFRSSETLLTEIQSAIQTIITTLGNIEQRLERVEGKMNKSLIEKIDIATSNSSKAYIRSELSCFEIIKETINEMTKGSKGIKKSSIDELYKNIIKDYTIPKEIFGEYLLMLYNDRKLQLEPGYMDDGFAIRDIYGNVFRVVRLLE